MDAWFCGLTVDLEPGEGLHFALFVGGGADVRPRVLLDDPRNRQHVDVLETLGGKFSFKLGGTRFESEFLSGFCISETFRVVTLDHLIWGVGYPEATQGRIASEPTVTSFFSGRAEI